MTPEEFQDHVLRLKLDGFTLLPGMLTREECAEAQRELERIFEEEKDLSDAAQGPPGGQAYALFNKARIFERLYQIEPVLRLVRHFLGEDAVLGSMQCHMVMPGAPAQRLHSDGSQTGPNRASAAADEGRRIVSHVLAFNVVYCISDYTKQNGATRLVPGSHRIAARELPDGPIPGAKVIEAERGGVLIFNISIWHGSSEHRGTEPRYAVMNPWRRQWLRPEADLSRIVKPEVLERAGADGPTIFGFTARPAELDRWQWDIPQGRPKPAWRHLQKDDIRK